MVSTLGVRLWQYPSVDLTSYNCITTNTTALQYNHILQLKYRHNGNAQAYTVYHGYEGSLIKDRDTWSNALFKASVYSFT